MLQYRVAPEGGVRDIDESKRQILVSYPWEVIDSYKSDFERSSFDEELSKRLPTSCWQHIRSEPIGHALEWQKTVRANDFVVQMSDFDAVPRARQAFVQIRDGDISDWSFGFDNATSVPHPDGNRSHIRFTKARMAEISPVTVGSIPGAMAVGVRAEADRAAIAELVREKVISPAEGRHMLDLAGDVPVIEAGTAEEPTMPEQQQERERIVITAGTHEIEVPDGARSVTLTINDDGTVSAGGYANGGGDTSDSGDTSDQGDPDEDAGQLASAVDAALDAYAGLMDGVDVTELPAVVQQALALVDAAGVAVDELLDAMGLPDPDEDGDRSVKGDEVTVGKRKGTVDKVMPNGALLVDWGDGKKSLVSAADASEADGGDSRAADEPDPAGDADGDGGERAPGDKDAANTAASNGEYADPGYQADKKKRYPLDSKARVTAALSYIGMEKNASQYSADDLKKVKANIAAAAKKFGIDSSDDSSRSDEPDIEATRAALDLLAVR